VLGVIPARGASKGIPRKNARELLGRPLVAWTIETARASGVLDELVLSTDDEEIAAVSRPCGLEVPFLRPADLASDETPTAPVVRHALEWLRRHRDAEFDLVVVLEPTSPARRPRHVREAVELLASSGADSVASVSPVPHHYAAEKQLRLGPDGALEGLDGRPAAAMTHRRQDLPACYAFDGLVFACRSALCLREPPTLWGERVLGYVVEPRYAIDLDRPEDWAAAEVRLAEIVAEESV